MARTSGPTCSGLPEPAPYADGLAAEYWEATRRTNCVHAAGDAEPGMGAEHICHHCHPFDLATAVTSWAGSTAGAELVPGAPALTDAVPYLTRPGGTRRWAACAWGNLLGDPSRL